MVCGSTALAVRLVLIRVLEASDIEYLVYSLFILDLGRILGCTEDEPALAVSLKTFC